MRNYLQNAYDDFGKTIKKKLGSETTTRFEDLEEAVAHVKKEKKFLTQEDIKKIFSNEYWPMEKWWQSMYPLLDTNDKKLGMLKFEWTSESRPLMEEIKIIQGLYDIFKHIEIVSIILRFVDPINYGIISPPNYVSVATFLQ